MRWLSVPMILLTLLPWSVQAQSASEVETLLLRHMEAFNNGQLEPTIAGYADTVVVITGAGITQGREAVRKLFTRILSAPPEKRPHLTLKARYFTAEFGYINWSQNDGTPNEVQGSDSFVVRGGQIVAQTVMAVPMHPAPHTESK